MKSLYLRVWLTLVLLLALFALASGVLYQRQFDQERGRMDMFASERLSAWADLIQGSLPAATADPAEQVTALREWSKRLRLPLALDDAQGKRIGASESFERRFGDREPDRPSRRDDLNRPPARAIPVKLDDGRTLWVVRRQPMGAGPGSPDPRWAALRWVPNMPGVGLAALLGLLFVGVAAGAYPVVRRLTRRLESLKLGVEQFGAGALGRRVDDQGRDEVAAVARSFNEAARRIESLIKANQSLLANASHELRSPLARMKMAVSMLDDDLPAENRDKLKREIHTNIAELDTLVDEVLLASRLEAQTQLDKRERVLLHGLVLEEAARVDAQVAPVQPGHGVVQGDERLLRRAVRNLLENARRYGGGNSDIDLVNRGSVVELRVADRGPGVPSDMAQRIFEPFFRLPGHAEREGGVGLGLSLVQQIAKQHGGHARCEARDGGGSVFVLTLPVDRAAPT